MKWIPAAMKRRTAKVMGRSRVLQIVGGALIVCLASATVVSAETKILEVQPWQGTAPTQLIVWGTEFGPIHRDVDPAFDTPKILFGTESDYLRIAEDQGLCYAPLGDIAPPLEEGYDCVVVDLPAVDNGAPNVPSGDYLLSIWVEMPANECVEKPSLLRFEYQPADCSGFNAQNADCAGAAANWTGALAEVCISAETFAISSRISRSSGGKMKAPSRQPPAPHHFESPSLTIVPSG